MNNPYCVCHQGVFCEACHEEMCAEAEEVSDGELAERPTNYRVQNHERQAIRVPHLRNLWS